MNTSNEIIIAPEVAMALLKEENISVNIDEAVAIIHLLSTQSSCNSLKRLIWLRKSRLICIPKGAKASQKCEAFFYALKFLHIISIALYNQLLS